MRHVIAVIALASSACSFTIQGPPSHPDPMHRPVCERRAPVRKSLDAAGLVGIGGASLLIAAIIADPCGIDSEPGDRCPALSTSDQVSVALLFLPALVYAVSLGVGIHRTAACGDAIASWDRQDAERRELAAAVADRSCLQRLAAIDGADPAARDALRATLPETCRRAAGDPAELARMRASDQKLRDREQAEQAARDRRAAEATVRARCRDQLAAWRRELSAWEKGRRYDAMPAECQKLADQESR